MIKKIFPILVFLFIVLPHFAGATVYYIDFTNGKDTNDGLGTTSDHAFQSLNKFANNARSAGDTAYVRRDMASTTNVTALTFTSNGTRNNPITISADYDNLWNGFTTLGITATPVFGSKTITVSASSTAVHNSWIYFGNDCSENATTSVAFINQKYNPCEYAYEVASSTTGTPTNTITLYLPYQGPSTGSGVAIRQMGKNPIVGDLSQANQILNPVGKNAWFFKGLDLRSTNATGIMNINFSSNISFYDDIFQTDGVTDGVVTSLDHTTLFRKTRAFGVSNFNRGNASSGGFNAKDFLIDCNNVANSSGITITTGSFNLDNLSDTEIVNCTNTISGGGISTGGAIINFRNLRSKRSFTALSTSLESIFTFEDDFSIVGLNSLGRVGASTAYSTTTMSTTTNLRSGGGPLNEVIFPPAGTTDTGISTQNFPFSYIKLFEYPIYSTATSHTYTMYFNSTSTVNFSTNPLTTTASGSTTPELYIECEYYGDATNANRFLKRSTGGTVNFSGSTAWQSISVQCSPSQAGILYLRGWYAKPKETNPSNWFYMDTTPVISTP